MPTACSLQAPFSASDETVRRLAQEYGTPLYVLSEECLRRRVRAYRRAFEDACSKAGFPAPELSYASKANGTLAVLAIAHAEGCLIDVASEGELRAALKAGVPASRCEMHGSNKQLREIEFALGQGVRTIVADNIEELEKLVRLNFGATKLVLRLAPGVDPITHKRIATGQEDSKFGFNISDGAAERALMLALESKLPVTGFHCHVGSQLLDPEAQLAGGEALTRFAIAMRARHGFEAQVINLGGGLGIAYTSTDSPPAVEEFCSMLVQVVARTLAGSGLNPVLMQEPGRALAGPCGATIYRVGVVKKVPVQAGWKTYVSVDGGLSDNPRPSMYDAEYSIRHIPSATRNAETPNTVVTVAGKHCETDDLFANVKVGSDIREGDLIEVLATGAYNSSMSNNYNRYPLPPTVLLREDGSTRVVVRSQTFDEMLLRESLPEDLTC